MRSLSVVYGPPGTGKTTRLVREMEKALDAGVPAERIAYVSFTKAAIFEATFRIREQFALSEDETVNCRTIHSMAYRLLGLTSSDKIMDSTEWKEFRQRFGYDFSTSKPQTSNFGSIELARRTSDDPIRHVAEWARCRQIPLEEATLRCPVGASHHDVKEYARRLRTFKDRHDYRDFSDLLEESLDEGHVADVELALIDEAQDLSPLQIACIEQWFSDADVIVAGDDDQALYDWAGADPTWLVSLYDRADRRKTLPHSHRIPDEVHDLALRIIQQNKNRVRKDFASTGHGGRLDQLDRRETLSVLSATDNGMLLARNRQFLRPWMKELIADAVPFRVLGSGGSSPLDHEGVIGAVKAAHQILAQEPVSPSALRHLLEYFPSQKGNTLLPWGAKTKVANLAAENAAAPDFAKSLDQHEMIINLGLGDFIRHLRNNGPWALPKMKKSHLDYLRRVHHRYGRIPPARVTLSTVHTAKGREADTVVVLPDMSRSTYQEFTRGGQRGFEAENRAAYVAVTRARESLILVEPSRRQHYPYRAVLAEGGRQPKLRSNTG